MRDLPYGQRRQPVGSSHSPAVRYLDRERRWSLSWTPFSGSFALQGVRLGKAVTTPASVGRQVELRVLARRLIPGVVFLHRPAAHRVDVRRAVVPGRDGPPDRVREALWAEIVEREAGPGAGRLVVARH